MTFKKILGTSFLLSTLLWAVFSWPLPRHFSEAIPSAATNVLKHNLGHMIPGDHLQLLYHFWLFQEMLFGDLPWLHNVYEFNLGNDADTYKVSAYFFPFSFLFSLFDKLGGQAFGWNLTAFTSVWMGLFFTWLLARRYTKDEGSAVLCALATTAFPYRFETLLGGSPTGLAMAFVPALFLGLDWVIRDRLAAGAWLAGFSIFFAGLVDQHVFFFGALGMPLWCVFAYLRSQDAALSLSSFRKDGAHTLARIRSFIPILPFLLLSFAYASATKQALSESRHAAGRTLAEVSLYSPRWQALWGWDPVGITAKHAYFGFGMTLILFLGMLVFGFCLLKRHKAFLRDGVLFFLLFTGIACVIFLALGTRGPWEQLFFRAARKLIPHYSMIRQTAKIFCVLPTLLAVGAALIAGALPGRWGKMLLGVLLCAVLIEYKGRVDPCLSLLDKTQEAYEAVADDARALGMEPRIVALPIWPGDSAWASLYEYGCSLSRVRMVNGYNPFVPKNYFEDVFLRLESMNEGVATDAQLDFLLEKKVGYVLLHEDAFPEKVSPFPVVFTLKKLLNHPRLEFLKKDKAVWAFRILKRPRIFENKNEDWNLFFPSRLFEAEQSKKMKGKTVQGEDTSAKQFLKLQEAGDFFETKAMTLGEANDLHWMIRLRGKGELNVSNGVDGFPVSEEHWVVDEKEWAWKTFSAGNLARPLPLILRCDHGGGGVDVDVALLVSGKWETNPALNEAILLPAPVFFHAGFTESDKVRFLKGHVHADIAERDPVLYGPRLPLEAGNYKIECHFKTNAPLGARVGKIQIKSGNAILISQDLLSGHSAFTSVKIPNNLPVNFEFIFFGDADVDVKEWTITRLSE